MSTAIEWTDQTDNIIVAEGGGWWCRKISPGCAHCYAEKLNHSTYFHGNKLAYAGQAPALTLKRDIIEGWARQTKAKRHFVASMTDVFGDWVRREWQFAMLDGMRAAPRQTFQVLTKRADVMRNAVLEWLEARGLDEVPANIWLGVSVENQRCADERIPVLQGIPARVRFLSVEPLLEAVKVDRYDWLKGCGHGPECYGTGQRIDWVIIGGESGPGARPCNVEWIRGVVSQCHEAGVPCFVKQLGSEPRVIACSECGQIGCDCRGATRTTRLLLKHPKGGDPAEWPEDLNVREFPKA